MSPTPATCETLSNEDEPNTNGDDNPLEDGSAPPQIFASSSETEEDEDLDFVNNGGYELLPQNPGESLSHEDDDVDPDLPSDPSDIPLADTVIRDAEDRITLWESIPSNKKSINIDQEQADKIKAAMTGFVLPSSSVPGWAKAVPEEKWMAKLAEKIKTESDCDILTSVRNINAQQ